MAIIQQTRISLLIKAPVGGETAEITLPCDLTLKDSLPCIVALFKQNFGDTLLLSDHPVLFVSTTGEPLQSPDATFHQLGIKDGDVLYLV